MPDAFRFAVKLPKVITHELRLVGADAQLDQFPEETSLIVQSLLSAITAEA